MTVLLKRAMPAGNQGPGRPPKAKGPEASKLKGLKASAPVDKKGPKANKPQADMSLESCPSTRTTSCRPSSPSGCAMWSTMSWT
jgi:hypothetical protein